MKYDRRQNSRWRPAGRRFKLSECVLVIFILLLIIFIIECATRNVQIASY